MSVRSNWRDCQEWRRYGLPFSSTNDESLKLFDATITQFAGFYDDPSLGGVEKTIGMMIKADPGNVMGHAASLGLDLLGRGRMPRLDEDFRSRLKVATDLTKEGSTASDWEKRHIEAVVAMADGYLKQAGQIWDDILVDYPLDFLAARFAFTAYIYLGLAPQRKDSTARILPLWTPDMPHYGYLLGMHGFGLIETNNVKQAEIASRKALEINPRDIFSNHSLIHVFEHCCRYEEALQHMKNTVNDWSVCSHFACHTFWHWALFHIEKGEYEPALDFYDSKVGQMTKKSHNQFNMTDSVSLLFRLEMEGVDVGGRWSDLYDMCRSWMDPEEFAFADPHITLSYLRANRRDEAVNFCQILEDYSRDGGATDGQVVKREVGADLCRSLVAYHDKDYGKAVDLLNPVKYKIHTIGGSDTQRDVFNQFLIHSATKSSNPHHHKLARALLLERKENYETESPLTERLLAKVVIDH